MAEHTAAPWTYDEDSTNAITIYAEDGREIATVLAEDEVTDEDRANARLIASAPEMLALLEELADELGDAIETHIYEDVPDDAPELELVNRATTLIRKILDRPGDGADHGN